MSARSGAVKWRLVRPAGFAARNVLRILGGSARYVVCNGERLEELRRAGKPVVVSFWHDQSFTAGWYVIRELHRSGVPLTLLASHSHDGEMLVHVGRPWGMRVVRGSASRGGRAAILALYRELVDHGSSPVIVPDGPRGPAHVCKLGALLLSKMAKVPILPLGFSPDRAWSIGSWDRMSVPKIATRIGVAVGEPLQVDRAATAAELEELSLSLAATLDGLVDQARAALAS